jgi:hypothetical protein
MPEPRGVLLVGSVPLSNSEAVFRTASSILGGRLRRIPDGETGERSDWIVWQFPVFSRAAELEVVPPGPELYRPLPRVQLRRGASVDSLHFDKLGYADAAAASYATFTRLRGAGVIPSDVRFQVCLPTPLAPISAFVVDHDQAAIEAVYEAAMLAELDRILNTIPHPDLALQRDTAVEFGIYEGRFPSWFGEARIGIVERLLRLGAQVPSDVELGYHLCYGDAKHRHFKEPDDTAKLVDIANALTAGVGRPLQWIHMPVPRSRDDDAYFAPLRELRIDDETELYLGLVHNTDGVEGTRRRIQTAQKVREHFGVATECGMGRRSPETIPGLLRIHAALSR